MQGNEKQLENQLKMQYSISHGIIDSFNKTIRDIEHNELLIASRINEFNEIAKGIANHQNVLLTKDIYNQLIMSYSIISNILRDVETSITFCKLSTIHPSIIKPHDLFTELQKISLHYKEELPYELKYENILDFEPIIRVNCKVQNSVINYFLSIPIDFKEQFELYYLLPIPTKSESEFVTIIPDVKYLLKSKNDKIIKALSDICTQGRIFHCSSRLQLNHKALCEEHILLDRNVSHCQFIKLNVQANHLEIIPEINQYLAVFLTEEVLNVNCQKESETKSLKGIYLIKEDGCKIFFKEEEMSFLEETHGKPMVVNELQLKLNEEKVPDMKINLKTLNLREIPVNPIVPIGDQIVNYYVPSVWTATLYLVLSIIVIYLAVKWFKSRKEEKSSAAFQSESTFHEMVQSGQGHQDKKSIQLPGGASF